MSLCNNDNFSHMAILALLIMAHHAHTWCPFKRWQGLSLPYEEPVPRELLDQGQLVRQVLDLKGDRLARLQQLQVRLLRGPVLHADAVELHGENRTQPGRSTHKATTRFTRRLVSSRTTDKRHRDISGLLVLRRTAGGTQNIFAVYLILVMNNCKIIPTTAD